MTVNPSYGTPPPPPPPPPPGYGGEYAIGPAIPNVDPVKAHAAYCAAVVLQGEAQRTTVSEYDAKRMCEAFEQFLRGK